MNQFFAKVTQDHWTPKNKLQAEAKQLARNSERQLIHDIDMDNFVAQLYLGIEQLNAKYHRCQPLQLEKANWDNNNDPYYYIPSVFSLTFYKVKQ